MKFLALLAFVGLGGFAWWEDTKISGLNQELERLRAVKPAASVAPQSEIRKIICPLCRGERVVVVHGPSKVGSRAQTCPVCVGVGYRELKVLPGYKVCPDCRGMGIAFHKDHADEMPQHGNCARCYATGLVADVR